MCNPSPPLPSFSVCSTSTCVEIEPDPELEDAERGSSNVEAEDAEAGRGCDAAAVVVGETAGESGGESGRGTDMGVKGRTGTILGEGDGACDGSGVGDFETSPIANDALNRSSRVVRPAAVAVDADGEV